MQFRQIIVLLISLIAIVGAALLVIVWAGGDDEATSGDAEAVSITLPGDTPSTGDTATGDTGTGETTSAGDTTGTTDTTAGAADGTATTETTAATSSTTTTIPLNCVIDSSATSSTSATTTASGTSELKESSKISTRGLGPVTFGLTVEEAEKAAGTTMIPCAPVTSCYRVTPAAAPEGLSFVVQSGRIERVDIARGPITTVSGVGIGTTEARIIELFGEKIQRSAVDGSRVDLVFVPVDEIDSRFRVIFTMKDGVVENFRAGRTAITTDRTPCA